MAIQTTSNLSNAVGTRYALAYQMGAQAKRSTATASQRFGT